MFIDASTLAPDTVIESDVCVIGAGAAGITIALGLAKHGLDVVLVESGGLTRDPETQRLYEGRTVGAPYALEASRLRYLGGSTNHWGGLCRPLEEADFLPRPWIEHSGWPIRKSHLDPYYEKAFAILDIPYRRRFEDVEQDTEGHPRLLGPRNEVFEPVLWSKSPPTRMGEKYRDEVARSSRIRCYLHANAVELVPEPSGRAVRQLRAKSLAGHAWTFSARRYVLCAGGIESARLLLLSDAVVPDGIGNGHGLVGRFFLEHPNQFVGRMVVASPPGRAAFQEEYVQERARDPRSGIWDLFFGFAARATVRQTHRLLGCSVNAFPADPNLDAGAAAVGELVTNPLGTAHADRPSRIYRLGVVAEQRPNPESRVLLTTERDALGQRKVAVDLRLTSLDVRSIDKSLRLFAIELARCGSGRAQLDAFDPSSPMTLVGHHMGTTRMADDPRRGVTDADGRIHGVDNLYVAGSSLFPTAGFANPTVTIVALALRLVEHLAVRGPAVPDV
jgi:choline dehydrogenase-like flavoprotein